MGDPAGIDQRTREEVAHCGGSESGADDAVSLP